MRYTPAALALSLLVAVTGTASLSAPPEAVTPRAAALLAEGRSQLAAGNVDAATDAFEAALTVQPGQPAILIALADATRKQGMQGKAIHYYRRVLETDPQNVHAIAGEGAAFAEKGALDRARRNLTRVESLCGKSCDASRQLAAAITKGPAPRVVTAAAVTPAPVVSDN